MEKRWGKLIAARASLTAVCCRARDQGGQTWGGTNVTTQSDPSDCGSALTAPDSRSRANTRFGFSTSPVLAGRTAERLNVGVLWAVACPHSLALPGWFPVKRLLRRRYLWPCRSAGVLLHRRSCMQAMRPPSVRRANFNRARRVSERIAEELRGEGARLSAALGLGRVSHCRDSKFSQTLNTHLKREILASRLSATSQALTARSEPCAMTPRRRLFSL